MHVRSCRQGRGGRSWWGRNFPRGVRVAAALCAALISAASLAQKIEIKLVNGRDGRPVSHAGVNVWAGDQRKEAMVLLTDSEGVARLTLTNKESDVDVRHDPTQSGEHVVLNPTVLYPESLRINVGFVLCQPRGADWSWLWIKAFDTRKVLDQGVVGENTCGDTTASPKPGTITLFVRPLHWWESLKE